MKGSDILGGGGDDIFDNEESNDLLTNEEVGIINRDDVTDGGGQMDPAIPASIDDDGDGDDFAAIPASEPMA